MSTSGRQDCAVNNGEDAKSSCGHTCLERVERGSSAAGQEPTSVSARCPYDHEGRRCVQRDVEQCHLKLCTGSSQLCKLEPEETDQAEPQCPRSTTGVTTPQRSPVSSSFSSSFASSSQDHWKRYQEGVLESPADLLEWWLWWWLRRPPTPTYEHIPAVESRRKKNAPVPEEGLVEEVPDFCARTARTPRQEHEEEDLGSFFFRFFFLFFCVSSSCAQRRAASVSAPSLSSSPPLSPAPTRKRSKSN